MGNWRNNRIYKALKSVYYKFLVLFFKHKGVRYSINGFRFRMPAIMYEYFPFRYFPYDYEKENFIFFRQKAKEDMTCIDIGAHVGLYAVFMNRTVNARVFSFEPTPASQQVFKEMMRVNNCNDLVTLVPAAVAGHSGKTIFYMSEIPLNVANSLVDAEPGSGKRKGYPVDIISVDEFVKQQGIRVNFIKIDAEGAELDVLKGSGEMFLRDKPSGIIGLHPFAFKNPSGVLIQIWDILKQYNLEIYFDNKPLSEKVYKKEFINRKEVFDLQFSPADITNN